MLQSLYPYQETFKTLGKTLFTERVYQYICLCFVLELTKTFHLEQKVPLRTIVTFNSLSENSDPSENVIFFWQETQ